MSFLRTLPTHLDQTTRDIMLAESDADSGHDVASRLHNEYFDYIMGIVYGHTISIDGKAYGKYAPDNDPFTKGIEKQSLKYRMKKDITFENERFDSFNLLNENGPVPRVGLHAFMKRFYVDDVPNKNLVFVADNVTGRCLSEFIKSLNRGDIEISESISAASVIDMGSRCDPGNWGQLLYHWWDAKVTQNPHGNKDNNKFSIDLTAIGAVRIPTTLTLERNSDKFNSGGDILTVTLEIDRIAPLTVRYNLNRGLNASIMYDNTGTYSFFLGKDVAVQFFILANTFKPFATRNNAANTRSIRLKVTETVKKIVGGRGPSAADITEDINRLFGNYTIDEVAIILPIVKLIGDLLFPLCSSDDCFTLSSDKLLICRCIVLGVDALLRYSYGSVEGFYYFKKTLDSILTDRTKKSIKKAIKSEFFQLETIAKKKIKELNAPIDAGILIQKDLRISRDLRNEKMVNRKKIHLILTDLLDEERPRSIYEYIDELNERLHVLAGGNQNINIKLIKVKWNRNTYEVDVTLSDNVLSLKDKIFSLTGVSPTKQKLILAGKTLKNDASLESSNIKQGSVLLMIGVVDVEKKVDIDTTPPPNINEPDEDEPDDDEPDDDEHDQDNFLHATKSYTSCVIEEVEIFIDVLKKILENSEKILFILKNGNKPTQLLPDGFRNFIGFLKSFLEESIKKLKDRKVLIGLYNTDDVIASLETILNVTTKMFIVVEDKDTGIETYYYVPYNIPYDDIIIDISLLLDINLPENFDSIIADININETKQDDEGTPSLDILLLGDKDVIIRRLVTYILDNIENNKEILEKELPKIYDLLKGKDIETIVSKNNINPLYFSIMPSVLSIMNSYNVFKEDVELELIRAIVQNNKEFLPGINEHKILTDSIYSLYRNMTGLYGVYVYDIEIIKSFIEGINLQNNRLEFVGGFRSFQTIIDIRCNTDLEKMNNDSETYVSLSHVIKQISNIVDFIINKLHENNISENEISTMSKDKLKGYIDNFLKTIEKHQPEQPEQQDQQQQLNPLDLQHGNIFSVPNAVPVYGGNNNPKSKHNAKYRKKYKKFVSKYIIKKNKKQNKTKNKSTHTTKTKKNKKIAKNKSNYTKKILKNKNNKRNHKSNHKSKHNKKAKTNYYNLYKHHKTLKY